MHFVVRWFYQCFTLFSVFRNHTLLFLANFLINFFLYLKQSPVLCRLPSFFKKGTFLGVDFWNILSIVLSKRSKNGFSLRIQKAIILLKQQIVNDEIAILLIGVVFEFLASSFVLFEIRDKFAIMIQMRIGKGLLFFGTGLLFLFFLLPQKLVRVLLDWNRNELVFFVLEKTLMRQG